MTFVSTPADRFAAFQVRKTHFSSKCRTENLSWKSDVLIECATSVHCFPEKSQATQWGGEKYKLLPWMGNRQLSRGAPYATKQPPVFCEKEWENVKELR